jgi:hypothetical protein
MEGKEEGKHKSDESTRKNRTRGRRDDRDNTLVNRNHITPINGHYESEQRKK